MKFDKNAALEALKVINQPGSGKNIVEGGALKNLDSFDDEILAEVVLHTPAMNIREKIQNQVQYVLQKLYPEATVKVVVTIEKLPPQEKTTDKTALAGVKKIIAVASGKGGVGKSTLTANLAVALAGKGYRVGLVDADIYGPSMPIMFDLENARPTAEEIDGKTYILPSEKYGVKIQSIGFFANPGQAMVWRGAMATKALQQMIFETLWGELDFLLIDLPPGTGDIHLTLVQALPLDGVVVITTPQSVALNDALRAVDMFRNENIDVPILGVVENMAYFTPPELPDKKYYIFGQDGAKHLSEDAGIPFLGEIPLVESIRQSGDVGSPAALNPESVTGQAFSALADKLIG